MSQNTLKRSHRIEYEKSIASYISKFLREKTGKGPELIKVKIIENIIDITIINFFSKFAKNVIRDSESVELLKKIWIRFAEIHRKDILNEMSRIVNGKVTFLHVSYDMVMEKAILTFLIDMENQP